MAWTRRELYGAESDPQIAQRLHDEGLLWAVNRLVLHELGLALGVTGVVHDAVAGEGKIAEQVTVQKVMLVASDDPITYAPADDIRRRALAKMRAAGHHHLADWAERITA